MRHYFPGIDIDKLSDEQFAIMANDAEWFHQQQVITRQANALGMLA